MTPGQAAAALGNLPIAETLHAALDAAAMRLAEGVRSGLATPPGGPHAYPWRRSGTLEGSIDRVTTDLTAEIGSNDPAAAAQEYGTATIPPRPFLAPVAEAMAESMSHDIATALTALLVRAVT